MRAPIITLDEDTLKGELTGLVRKTVEEVTKILWDEGVSAGTVSSLNQEAFKKVDAWRKRPLACDYPYVYVDGTYVKRNWGGSYESMAVLVAIGAYAEAFPEATCQRCTVHFYRNVLAKVPQRRRRAVAVAAQPEAIHAQELLAASARKAEEVAESLRTSRLADAAKVVEEGYMETLTYARFPPEHWRCIRTNNGIERLNREIKRRTKAVASFPDGEAATTLVAARCKFVAEGSWGSRRYLDVGLPEGWDERSVAKS